ncbi:hypothetical protein J2T55_001774 [Methylohalomonas lacus]|uniref:Uncharacterized protein n=1 Tax=Methylohalomonas lacus TaxID=398773 RepID=A0AAE3L4E8_9GAMM|nr:hypothetical protein [Methylohalomonas lacus]MCS3903743.1 hypothetical protein [Methylohalomonas lacus]
MNNRETFLSLIFDNELERVEVAEMLCVDRDQVDRWLAAVGSRNHEDIPDMAVELLRLKLKLAGASSGD